MLSIIIPAYNAARFAEKCLDSILKQTYTNFEVIIINDGSTDNTGEILENYKKTNHGKNITVFHTENKGHSIARNFGVSKATKEYIWFIDIDDVLYNDGVFESAVSDLTSHNPDIYIFSAFETDYKKREKIWHFARKNTLTNIYESPLLVFKQNWSWNKPIKREFLINSGVSFPNVKMFEDIYFYIDLYFQAKKIYITRDVKYVYVKHQDSLTGSLDNFNLNYPIALFYELKAFMKIIFKVNK